ncbi:hypothetical protein J7J13_02045 [bacterium]|nr:hypothetical protein [bacterium]
MGRKKVENRNVRKLAKVGGGTTYAITLPIDTIRLFGWKEKQKMIIETDKARKRIIIKDWKK